MQISTIDFIWMPIQRGLIFALLMAVGPFFLHLFGNTAAVDGYLFAHMTKADYGRLYYSVSEDGLHWRMLNESKRVHPTYRGHPEICQGPDGRYWLVGVAEEEPFGVILYESKDLVTWDANPLISADLFDAEDRFAGRPSLGAPKLFYDDKSRKFFLTWHAALKDLEAHRVHNVNEARWSSMRTFVMTSENLDDWSEPQRLFQYDIATIDVIIRKEGDRYYAILKDEKYPTFYWPTGKSIRIASSESPLGPWTQPGPAISPNYHEAPTLIPIKDGTGWLMYHEQYPGVQYGLSTAPTLGGEWYNVWINTYEIPTEARHGCMIPVSFEELKVLEAAFSSSKTEE